MNFIPTDQSKLQHLRITLYNELIGPVDGMWESLYIAASQGYNIEEHNTVMGYACIDSEDFLLQLYVVDQHKDKVSLILQELIRQNIIKGARLSSIEPLSFNACIGKAKTIEEHTFCYHQKQGQTESSQILSTFQAVEGDIEKGKNYYKDQIGFEDTFGYVAQRVARGELYFLMEHNEVIATGECRMSDTQIAYADIGMSVHQNHRRKGIGARMLSTMAHIALQKGRTPICSTTTDNIGSQKAILNANFYCSSIIFEMEF